VKERRREKEKSVSKGRKEERGERGERERTHTRVSDGQLTLRNVRSASKIRRRRTSRTLALSSVLQTRAMRHRRELVGARDGDNVGRAGALRVTVFLILALSCEG
jgi:hypothetical protein